MSLHGGELADWTAAAITKECAAAYAGYERRRTDRYRRYFQERPELRGGHPFKARALEQVLPQTWGGLAALLPSEQRHRHILSGKSSQALTLGLLGPALSLDRSGEWLTAFGAPAPTGMPHMRLEVELDADVLDEHPRTTAVDFLVDAPDWVLCLEAKWTETGMGTCSCTTAPTPTGADCSKRVLERTAYWETAHELFGLPDRDSTRACPLHPT